MGKFIIDTKKAADFDPIVIVLDGREIVIDHKIDSDFMAELNKFHTDQEYLSDPLVGAKQFSFLTGLPLKVTRKLEVRQTKEAGLLVFEERAGPSAPTENLKKKD